MGLLRTAARPFPGAVQRAARRQLVRYRHTGLRPADALLDSYPKSGSTWLRFLLAHALTSAESDFDSVRHTVPAIGGHRGAPALLPGGGRLVRSHESLAPYRGPVGGPVVALVRDGRDVLLSYLAHERRYGRADGDVAAFVDRFLTGRVGAYGPWHEHVLAAVALEASGRTPVLRVRYEDLRRSPVDELGRILAFLGVAEGRPGAVPLDEVVARNTKASMRSKEAVSTFLAGKANDGSPLVRPDDRESWDEVVPAPSRRSFERVCAGAMEALGYEW